MHRSIPLLLASALLAGAALAPLAFALAPARAQAQTPQEIRVKVGATTSVMLPRKPKFLGVENSELASATVMPSGKVKVTGKKAGRTRLVGRDFADVPMVIPILVQAR